MIRFCLTLVLAFLSCPLLALGQSQESFDVVETTIGKIHSEMKSGKLTCLELVQAYFDRIEKYDQPTKLNSVIILNSNALKRAKELDEQFRKTGKLLPLHGIPVIVKDNYDTHDLQTTAGSIALKDSLPPDDAWQVRKLREAGAIVLCKSNMAEWAYSPWFTESSIAGTTVNPYDLTRVPAGSSGGTAAAVAASFGTFGLGTDTGNSIRGPSSHCCLVGIRPTQGLTSRDGIVPLFLRNDIGGPMCRTVEDAARVLEVIAGHDPNDAITAKSIGREFNYVSSLDINGLKGARIGVFRTLSDTPTTDKEFHSLFETAIDDVRAKGATIVDPFEIAGLDNSEIGRIQGKLWIDTFRHDIEEYLKTRNAPIKSLEAIINSREHGPFLKGRLNNSKNSKIPVSLKKPYSADAADDPNRAAFLARIIKEMDAQKIDAFIFPTWNNPPRKVGDMESPDGNNSYHISPSTGLPSITVPMGFNKNGLPAGLQFVGREFSEATLFKLSYAYEQATHHRKAPKLFPKLEEVTLRNVAAPNPNTPEEPMAATFSLNLAAKFLDSASLQWQKENDCMTCHTNYAYLYARPNLGSDALAHRVVRSYAEQLVDNRWKKHGPRWDSEVVASAAALAFNDAATTKTLHPTTRQALDRMWTVQRKDGGWSWLKCGWPPMESDDHYGVTLAAIAVGVAPENYLESPAAKIGMEKLREYLKANPPPTLHHRAMLLWAESYLDGLIPEFEKQNCVEKLLELQRPDGGWALATLGNWARADGKQQDLETSDGYGTGFVIYALRRAGLPADAPQIQKGVIWLKTHQRESGRWFTRSLNRDNKHYISHAGSAMAILALSECGALK